MRIIEKDIFLEQRIQEIMDKAIKDIKKKVDNKTGLAQYEFVIEKNIPEINEYSKDIKFKVNFSEKMTISVRAKSPLLDNVGVRFFATNLTFSNSVSGMQELGDYMIERGEYDLDSSGEKIPKKFSSMAVYGTMGRILSDYMKTVPEKVIQGLHFTTAHSGLVKPYIILSKEAEKKGGLIWVNPFKYERQSRGRFDLIRKTLVTTIKQRMEKE
jgi:hypothetical protein